MRIVRHAIPVLTATLFVASAAFAAEEGGHGGHHGVNWVYVGSLFFNVAAVAVLLIMALRRPVATFFAKRADEIEDKLHAAERARQAAEEKAKEYAAKIDELVRTREEVLVQSRKEADYEKEKILVAAQRQAAKLIEDVEKTVAVEFEKARRQLMEEVAAGVVEETEKVLRRSLTPADGLRLSDDYIEKLREVKRV
ncbi:MAG: hypothetical protein C4523_16520 [Myxococcales bacterium]|nr:MAG: hypothetical protein C4523_16520 [Myxococcales bacterium]